MSVSVPRAAEAIWLPLATSGPVFVISRLPVAIESHPLTRRDTISNESGRYIEFVLPTAGDVDNSALLHKSLGRRAPEAAAAACYERYLPCSLDITLFRLSYCREPGSRLLRRWRQKLVVDQRLQCVAERCLSINRFCEPGLAQLDGADEGARSRGGTKGKREVRMLVPLANQLPKVL